MQELSALFVGGEMLERLVVRKAHEVNLVGQIDRAFDDAVRRRANAKKKLAAMLGNAGNRHRFELVEDTFFARMNVNKLGDQDHRPASLRDRGDSGVDDPDVRHEDPGPRIDGSQAYVIPILDELEPPCGQEVGKSIDGRIEPEQKRLVALLAPHPEPRPRVKIHLKLDLLAEALP